MWNALVLDVTGRPIDVVGPERSITLCMSGRATAILNWEKVYHSETLSFPVPKVISLKVYVPIPKAASKHVSNALLFARDNWTCQYCGRDKSELPRGVKLTREHIKPVCKFPGTTRKEQRLKATTWENLVTACSTCNNKKGDRTPMEAGMRLISDKAPRRPQGLVITLVDKVKDEEQLEFLKPFLALS